MPVKEKLYWRRDLKGKYTQTKQETVWGKVIAETIPHTWVSMMKPLGAKSLLNWVHFLTMGKSCFFLVFCSPQDLSFSAFFRLIGYEQRTFLLKGTSSVWVHQVEFTSTVRGAGFLKLSRFTFRWKKVTANESFAYTERKSTGIAILWSAVFVSLHGIYYTQHACKVVCFYDFFSV